MQKLACKLALKNAVERSGENIRTDSVEEALPYELVIVEAEKK